MADQTHPSDVDGTSKVSFENGQQFLAQILFFSAALVAVFFAGGPHQGGMGIFLATAGGVLLVFPLRRVVPWELWGGALFFTLAVALALLPAKWLLLQEEWKSLFQGLSAAIPGFSDPVLISADPQNTVFWLSVLSASLLTGLYCLGCSLAPRQLKGLAFLACLGCAFYAALALAAWRTGWQYPFFIKDPWAQPILGFFPNRNHTAGFLLTGTIVALGLMWCEIRTGRFFAALLAMGLFLLLAGVLLFVSVSRGGLFFLLVGGAIWMLGLGRHLSRSLLLLSVLFFAVMLTLFLQSGSGLAERVLGGKGATEAVDKVSAEGAVGRKPPLDGRVAIARDTLSMIAAHPVAGTGLGTYAQIYPFYADQSLRYQTSALHAESDWLTLCEEGGIPAVLLAIAALGMLCSRIPQLAARSGREWPLRWAFLSACFAELLHGLVDVPLHRPELGWWILLLGGVGFAGFDAEGNPREDRRAVSELRLQRGIFLAGGLAMIFLGSSLILAQWRQGPPLPPFAAAAELDRIVHLSSKGDEVSLREAIVECRRAVSEHPMEHLLLYELALLSLQGDRDIETAERLFAVERRIFPNDAWLVFDQGNVLADADPVAAAEIWKEALRREIVIDEHPSCEIPRATDLFGYMISDAQGHPALFERLPMVLGAATPQLRMSWYARPDCTPAQIAEAAGERSFMEQLDANEQGRLIGLWWRHPGEQGAVEAFLMQHPEYARAAVETRAAILASLGQEKEACLLLVETFHLPMCPPEASAIHSAGEDVPSDPLAAASYYLERGNTLTARRLLAEASAAEKGETNEDQAHWVKATLEMQEKNWAAALRDLIDFLHASNRL